MGENANISPNWSWQRVLDEDGIEQVTPYSTGYSGWKATPYWGTELEGKSPSTITNMMRERSQQTNPNYKSRNESIWDAWNDHREVDNKKRQEIYNTGTGTGYYITNGKVIDMKWSKPSHASKTKYMDMNGNELPRCSFLSWPS